MNFSSGMIQELKLKREKKQAALKECVLRDKMIPEDVWGARGNGEQAQR